MKGVLEEIALAARRAVLEVVGGEQAERLGELVALEVARVLGGNRVYIPCCRGQMLRARAAALAAKGLDCRAIARRLGISERHARRLVRASG